MASSRNQSLFNGMMSCEERIGVAKERLRTETNSLKIANCQYNIKLHKTELLLYRSLMLTATVKEIFSRFLGIYDELMVEVQDNAKKMVVAGLIPESEYLDYCHSSLIQRDYIKTICGYGESKFSKKY